MKKVPVKMEDIELAFEMYSMDSGCWLDLETGEIISVNDEIDDQDEIDETNEKVNEEPERYVSFPEKDTHEEYRDMQDFADTINDKSLREKLCIALDGKGAFGRFKRVLDMYPEERKRWFSYKDEKQKRIIREWLEINEIEITG